MPLYEYECEKCSARFEFIQKFSDPPKTRCPKCKGRLKRLLSPPGLQFKGSGWYITDYARPGAASAGSSGSNGASSGTEEAERGESQPSESRPAESQPAAGRQAKPAARRARRARRGASVRRRR